MPRAKKTGKTSKKSKKVENVVEYFEVEKGGKEEVIESKGKDIVDAKPDKSQLNNENKLLRNILIALVILMLIFLGVYFFLNSSKSF